MVEQVLSVLGYGLCHQLPERSFFGGGVQLPVCARDTGIYIGFVVSMALIAWMDRRRDGTPHPALLALGGAFIAFMAWDGVTSYAGWRTTTNELRLATGLMTGWALPLVVVPMVNSSLWRDFTPERILKRPAKIAVWLLALPAAFALVRWGLPALGVAYPIVAAAAIVATFVSVNLIIVLLAPRFERRAARLRDVWPALSLALALSIAEVGAAALLRVWLQSLVRVG